MNQEANSEHWGDAVSGLPLHSAGGYAYAPGREVAQREIEELLRLTDEEASELLLVRHAQPAVRLQDGAASHDPLLSCAGLSQAELLADRLRDLWIEAVYTAPERRAIQTANIIASRSSARVQTLAGVREIEYGASEAGGSFSSRFGLTPRWDSLPGFAPSKVFRDRVVQSMQAALAEHPGRRIVVVSHLSVINAFVGSLLEVPRDVFFAPDHASVTVVRSCRGLHAIRSLNDTAHLQGIAAGA